MYICMYICIYIYIYVYMYMCFVVDFPKILRGGNLWLKSVVISGGGYGDSNAACRVQHLQLITYQIEFLDYPTVELMDQCKQHTHPAHPPPPKKLIFQVFERLGEVPEVGGRSRYPGEAGGSPWGRSGEDLKKIFYISWGSIWILHKR